MSANLAKRERCRFYRPGSADPAKWILERIDAGTFRVTQQIEYLDCDGFTYAFPLDLAHNTTDFASIPFFLTWLVPRDGRHTPAAILHDSFIGGTEGEDYATTKPEGVSDEHADYLFREAMRHAEVGFVRRWMMWAGVSLRTMALRRGTQKLSLVKIIPIGLILVGLAIAAALMELDVPDFQRNHWHLPWFGDLPWYTEIWHGLVTIGAASAMGAVVIGGILFHKRAASVGAIAGAIIGFFGLPMVASAVGWGGYIVLDGLISRFKEGHFVKPLAMPTDSTTNPFR